MKTAGRQQFMPLALIFAMWMPLILSGCKKETNNVVVSPKVEEKSLEVRPTKAGFSWTVDYPGKISSGVELGLDEQMTNATLYVAGEDTWDKEFSINADNLNEGTLYYYRYLVWNPMNHYETEVHRFTTGTIQPPAASTGLVTDIDIHAATFHGRVDDNGGGHIKECGFYYGVSPDPVTNGIKAVAATNEIGEFSFSYSSFDNNAVYYVCAFATNEHGTDYGDVVLFTLHPVGTANGVFSIGPDQQVRFSQGNLQYCASNRKWRFAEHQYDCIGDANTNISAGYDGWIDLFGWGTSGYHDVADSYNTNYQPYSTSSSTVSEAFNYCGYGPSTNVLYPDLTDTGYDWGVYNSISNGGAVVGQWWTLDKEEWEYVFNRRQASSVNGVANARYAKAAVAGMNGVILFPDAYVHPSDIPQPVGVNEEGGMGWSGNQFNAEEWAMMEVQGAVFLPAAGSRHMTTVGNVGDNGTYWSATNHGSQHAYCVSFQRDQFFASYDYGNRDYGVSVRLVRY